MSEQPVKVEYRVVPVTRFHVTRYCQNVGGAGGSCDGRGEYANAEVAYEVAYALAKTEHQELGWPPGDERMHYPNPELPVIRAGTGAAYLQNEIDRIRGSLADNPDQPELYAAQQALCWALEPGNVASPYNMIVRRQQNKVAA